MQSDPMTIAATNVPLSNTPQPPRTLMRCQDNERVGRTARHLTGRPGKGFRLSSAIMPRLLVVHHTPSPALQEMFEAAVSGARTDEIEGVEVVIRPALTAAAADVLQADGYLLGTPANIGYMSGALKHFFDGIYYPCLEATRRRPYGLYVHGGMDTTGAVRAVESITTGLQWRAVRPPVTVTGPPGRADLEACWELGALLAAEVAG
jgi:NADPH-dependent FMN reductase